MQKTSIRKASLSDIETIMVILSQAREYQLRSGHPQWAEGYPSEELIERDLLSDEAYILSYGQSVAGYAVLVENDLGYKDVEDTIKRWCAIHRIALSDSVRGKGLGKVFLGLLIEKAHQEGIEEIFIDTGEQNFPMQHLCTGLGFENLGLRQFSWGPRILYLLRQKNSPASVFVGSLDIVFGD